MRITVHFERDEDGRPRGAVALHGGGDAQQFHGWLELLRALEHLADRTPGRTALEHAAD